MSGLIGSFQSGNTKDIQKKLQSMIKNAKEQEALEGALKTCAGQQGSEGYWNCVAENFNANLNKVRGAMPSINVPPPPSVDY